ncbi:MAG: TlpA family protein disulfide reductase [Flavobacteriaceae bacterium]|nr:TlpA family protein disulfide reductase [Flavobacteriaceae bacterium]
MGRKLLYLFLLISFSALTQNLEPRNLFSKVIGDNIKTYRAKSQEAYTDSDFERADFLFDSLINNIVNGSYLDNFKVRKLSGRKIELYDFDKPVFLMTYASWCSPGSGEIPALNEIAKKHHKEIDFVILFWDEKSNVKKATKDYNKHITIVYVDEKENTNDHIVETMKHSLGFPTSFFINEDKMIQDVRRGVLHYYNEEFEISFELNYSSFLNGISLLKNKNSDKNKLSSKDK